MNQVDRSAARAPGPRGSSPHEVAILEAEVRRVIHALAPYGVLRQDALARACGAGRWAPGQFEGALEAAVKAGRVRRLPFGFYGRGRPRR